MLKLKNKKILILSVAAVLLVGSILFYLKVYHSRPPAESSAISPTETLNLDPPTDEERKNADDNKRAIVDREQQLKDRPASTGKRTVKPFITYAGQFEPQNQIEVGGYVPGIFEEGGVCRATFSQGSSNFSKQVPATQNANSVNCPVIKAARSDFSPKGNWSVVLSYDSKTASGSSETKVIGVN